MLERITLNIVGSVEETLAAYRRFCLAFSPTSSRYDVALAAIHSEPVSHEIDTSVNRVTFSFAPYITDSTS